MYFVIMFWHIVNDFKVFNIEIMPFTLTIKVILIRPLKMYKVMNDISNNKLNGI